MLVVSLLDEDMTPMRGSMTAVAVAARGHGLARKRASAGAGEEDESMKCRNPITALALAAVLVGCSAVYTPSPIGTAPLQLDPQSWDGTWRNADGAVELEVIDGSAGLLRAAWIEDTVLTKSDIYLLSVGEWILGSAKGDEKPEWYVWARVKKEDNRITLWVPSVTKFSQLVTDGTLSGHTDEAGDVMLNELTSEQLALIASETHGVLFVWDDPLVFWRLGD